ncbi:ATP-dependent DNA helicase [Cucurbitaria berberidis CBS 394.84]|uniref:ATP-dependent DNA helicase n=1 Tax=Cucurbitaria berberidis CBS 394.84 TaxID=1168544 RepID=A0A9P4GCZ0_9PLEO|nr:ATP-dependent DNA helicase [Cucurbitaria berberidis CBS 394.84]KAF1843300.1 ATP-dependent DNA helicase [Cucurbitaria berberidis CBS 394.84]
MSDTDFDLPSEDEEALAAATADVVTGKRSFERDNDHTTNPSKRSKIGETPNTTPSPNRILANKILKERFGLNGFRLEQEAAITHLLNGDSAVVVFPTGGGKSLCYQVPAVAFRYQDQELGRRSSGQSGVTLVISPLIALMKDQVDALLRRGINAAVLNSSVTRDQYLAAQDDLRNGRLDLIYCAPERLNSEGFIASLKDIPGGIRLLAVDEAHCISEWGHSFRPDYLKIARFAKEAKVERIVCLTATATLKVAEDIRNAFSIPKNGLFRTTMYRPNLRLLAEANSNDTDYKAKLVAHVRKYPGPTIVYVTLQKGAEILAADLKSRGFHAKPYHAGMTPQVRTKTQDEFLASRDMIVVATIAFGMGIDKPDIRSIVHFDIPDSIESYSQQIGRAGRDGKPSVCMFYLATKDFYLRNIFTYGDRPSLCSLRLLLKDLCSPDRARLQAGDTFTLSLYTQSREVDIKPTVLGIIYAQMELHFGLFRAAGAMYNKYKYIIKDPNIVLNDASPAASSILKASVKSSKWTHIALDELANSSGIARSDLVRKVDEWNERDAIQLEKEGVQNIFRLERPLPSSPQEVEDIIRQVDESMEATEHQNLARTRALLNLITDSKCFASAIGAYFGDSSDSLSEECGHCSWCETHKKVVLPDEPPQPPDPTKVKRILDKITVRDDPRFLAKIAFGIKSPRITALKVVQTGVFESMNVCDFVELLKVFTVACDTDNAKA